MVLNQRSLKKTIGITLGFFMASGAVRYLFEGEIKWMSLLISSIFFGSAITWALNNKVTKEE